jgi:hypothetical protein
VSPVAGLLWPAVGSIDQAYGDRNLVCFCLPKGSTVGVTCITYTIASIVYVLNEFKGLIAMIQVDTV